MANQANANPKPKRLNSAQIDLLIEALAVVLASPESLDIIFGMEAETEKAEAQEYLSQWLWTRTKQQSFRKL